MPLSTHYMDLWIGPGACRAWYERTFGGVLALVHVVLDGLSKAVVQD